MENKKLDAAASELLFSFMREMLTWETNLISAQQSSNGTYFDKNKEIIRESLSKIYDKYLTKKDRKTGKLAALNFGTPTEYNPDIEKIVSIEKLENKNKIIIETTYKTYIEFKRRYTINQSKDDLKIDKREDYSPIKGKWVAVTF